MPVMRLGSCCCGCTLRSGSLIIGCFEAIFFGLTLIGSIVICSFLMDPENYKDIAEERDLIYGLFVAFAVISAFQLSFSLMMMYGVVKDKDVWMLPWLIFAIFNICISIASAVINSIQFIAAGFAGGTAGTLSSSGLMICMKAYFALVIYNYYRSIKESRRQGIHLYERPGA